MLNYIVIHIVITAGSVIVITVFIRTGFLLYFYILFNLFGYSATSTK